MGVVILGEDLYEVFFNWFLFVYVILVFYVYVENCCCGLICVLFLVLIFEGVELKVVEVEVS